MTNRSAGSCPLIADLEDGYSGPGPLAGGLLADRFGRVRTLTVTYAAAVITVAAFGYAGRSLGVLAVLGVCVGVLAYAESPLLQAVFSDLAGDGAVIGWIISAAGFRPRSPRWGLRSRLP